MGDYITIQKVRDEGVTVAIAADSKVSDYIKTWQAILERVCRQWFESRTLTLNINGNDSDTLFFGVPIISITSLKINGSTTALDSTLYKVYSANGVLNDKKNPKISLIGPDSYRDIFAAPVIMGRLRFRKGRQNQEVKGAFGYIETDVVAQGAIRFVTKAELINGETFVLDDGANPAVTFYFDVSGAYVPPSGYDATNVRVNVSTDTTADNVALTAKTAINGATTLDITAGVIDTGGLLRLENDTGGVAGNQLITETVADTDFIIYGMAGGGVPYPITRALLKLVIEKLTKPIYDPGGVVTPVPSVLGSLLEEKTDGHSLRYSPSGGGFTKRRGGLSGITEDPEVLDILKLFRAPLGIASPEQWSYV